MLNDTPLIKKFKTEKNYYIYDTWTNEILKVHKDFWNYLDDGEGNNFPDIVNIESTESVKKEVQKAKGQGFLSTKRPEVMTFLINDNWKEEIAYQINHNLSQISLNVTEKCNFRCSYCAYSEHYSTVRNHSEKKMTWEVAKKAIEYAVKHSDDRANNNLPLCISFYGGEPLCNFSLIKKAVIFCKEKYPNKNISYQMTTNGSLINEKIAKFLVINNFNLVFSIDGPAHLHDRYRKDITGNPTHSRVMKGFNLVKKIVGDMKKIERISINCLMPPSVDIFSIEEFFKFYDNRITLHLPSDHKTTFFDQFDMTDEMSKYNSQVNQYFEVYKNDVISGKYKENKIGSALFDEDLVFIEKRKMIKMEKVTASHGQCIPGQRKLFVSCNGRFYPCEKVTEQYCIGSVENGIDFERVFQLLEDWSELFRNVCKHCWAIRFCSKCFVEFDPTDKFKNCSLEKMCYYKKKRIQSNLKKYCSILELNSESLEFLKDAAIV